MYFQLASVLTIWYLLYKLQLSKLAVFVFAKLLSSEFFSFSILFSNSCTCTCKLFTSIIFLYNCFFSNFSLYDLKCSFLGLGCGIGPLGAGAFLLGVLNAFGGNCHKGSSSRDSRLPFLKCAPQMRVCFLFGNMLFKIVWYFSTSVSFLGKRWKLSSLVLFCLLLLYHALLQPETKHCSWLWRPWSEI